jgi:hypothetical protein
MMVVDVQVLLNTMNLGAKVSDVLEILEADGTGAWRNYQVMSVAVASFGRVFFALELGMTLYR